MNRLKVQNHDRRRDEGGRTDEVELVGQYGSALETRGFAVNWS